MIRHLQKRAAGLGCKCQNRTTSDATSHFARRRPIYPTGFRLRPLSYRALAKIYPTAGERAHNACIASAGGQLVPCSNRCGGEVIEREAVLRPPGTRGSPRGRDNRGRTHRGLREQRDPHAAGDHARGVKDLLVLGRRSKSRDAGFRVISADTTAHLYTARNPASRPSVFAHAKTPSMTHALWIYRSATRASRGV